MKFYLVSQKLAPTTKQAIVIGNTLGHDLTLSHGKYHNVSTKTMVEGLGPCLKLTAWGGKDKFEAHSAPELEPIEAVGDRIRNIVEVLRGRMKNSFDEVHAFITGGVEYNHDNPVSKQSMDLLEEMYESLAKEGVPTTVIAAQRGDGLKTRISSIAYQDKDFIFGKPIDDVLSSDKQTLEEALNNHFDFVELDKNFSLNVIK